MNDLVAEEALLHKRRTKIFLVEVASIRMEWAAESRMIFD